jgi:hypothetical protein
MIEKMLIEAMNQRDPLVAFSYNKIDFITQGRKLSLGS